MFKAVFLRSLVGYLVKLFLIYILGIVFKIFLYVFIVELLKLLCRGQEALFSDYIVENKLFGYNALRLRGYICAPIGILRKTEISYRKRINRLIGR